MKRFLLTGVTGQVGHELQRTLAPLGEVIGVSREEMDFAHPERMVGLLETVGPDVVVNAAAYTAVDRAESESELAYAVNAIAPDHLARAAQSHGAAFIHISTDYVFDGRKNTPYRPDDPTSPLSVYGHSKLAGEQAVQQAYRVSGDAAYAIFRTAWVCGPHGKGNFVKTMLRLGSDREEIRVVADQVGSPTWAGDLAGAIAQFVPHLGPQTAGIYHYTSSGVASWYDFAIAIFEEARALDFPLAVQRVVPITTADYPTPARRPAYSVLACDKLAAVLGETPPHWRQGLRQLLHHLKQ